MSRVLIISYYFPPDGGAGTQRAAKFCKHLPAFGYQPTVLTREPRTERNQWEPEDRSLLPDVSNTRVVRVPVGRDSSGWASNLQCIDVGHSWIEPAFERATEIIESENIGLVLITMSPFDLAYLGRQLQAKLGVRVIYDLRDPWALDGWRLYSCKRKWRADFRVMKETLLAADGVIMNTSDATRSIAAAIPALDRSRIWTIPNGYDCEDFASTGAHNVKATLPPADGNFYLVHTGTFHSSVLYKYEGVIGTLKKFRHYRPERLQATGRTPQYLLQAAALLARQRYPLYAKLRIVFVGQDDKPTQRCIEESGVADIVTTTGYTPHNSSVGWLCRADALFLPLHGLFPGARSLIIPGKTYEYFASGTPILGALPAGDARELVERSGVGFTADPCDARQIADCLIEMLKLWNTDRLQRGPANWVKQYERRVLTERLAGILDAIGGSQRAAEADASTEAVVGQL